MPLKRRNFFTQSFFGIGGFILGKYVPAISKKNLQKSNSNSFKGKLKPPFVLSTWDAGLKANMGAWKALAEGGSSLDAVEAGVKVTESDIKNQTVGIGGLPDRDGHVTLDACIMDSKGNAGSVCFMENFVHPISVARGLWKKRLM
jgi:N4-(beta-N-acetylglucosaminyl)-L-asparaginase